MIRITTLGLALILLAHIPGLSRSQDGGPNRPRVWGKADRERIEAWETLEPAQREKLREALRDVWTDPAVINAREEVKQASEAYQAAIKAAVDRVDPELAETLAKVQGMSDSGPGGPPPGGPGQSAPVGPRGFDHEIRPPGLFESLPSEIREKIRAAESGALDSDSVKAARAELDAIRKEDDGIRRRRVEAHRKLRTATVAEMVRLDPSLRPLEKRLLGVDRDRPPRKEDEKGAKGKQPRPEETRGEKGGKTRQEGPAKPAVE